MSEAISPGVNEYPVLMSLDGIYKNGRHMGPALSVEVPNDMIIRIVRNHREVIFGASVHPYKIVKEMIEDTMQCIDAGARFFHWIPSVQQIDPEDERCIPFYVCLARERIPLLFHRGAEPLDRISGITCNRYNAPSKMKKALEAGVTVVAAHALPLCNNTNLAEDRQFFNELLEMLMVADAHGWDLYADISVFCHRSRSFYITKLRKEIQEGTISIRRLTEGWDSFIPQIHYLLEHQGISPEDLYALREIRDSHRPCEDMLRDNGIATEALTPMKSLLGRKAASD